MNTTHLQIQSYTRSKCTKLVSKRQGSLYGNIIIKGSSDVVKEALRSSEDIVLYQCIGRPGPWGQTEATVTRQVESGVEADQ